MKLASLKDGRDGRLVVVSRDLQTPYKRTQNGTCRVRSLKADTAAAKIEIMKNCGIHVVQSPADIGATVLKVLSPGPTKGGVKM